MRRDGLLKHGLCGLQPACDEDEEEQQKFLMHLNAQDSENDLDLKDLKNDLAAVTAEDTRCDVMSDM